MGSIQKYVVWALALILWGLLISIGFWLGHKITDRFDAWIADATGAAIRRKIEEEEATTF